MHKVWLDTNVLLDYLLRRTGFEEQVIELIGKIERNEVEAYTSVISLIHTRYQLRKYASEPQSRAILENLLRLVHTLEIPVEVTARALANYAIPDFEDAVQFELALLSESNFLLTRNVKDFTATSDLIVCSVEHYLRIWHVS